MHAQDDLNLGILHMFKGAGLGAQLDACPTGDQEVAEFDPHWAGNILSWRLIMKYYLWSFSSFH